ncbi:Ribosomal protein L7A family protein [Alteracholeplasma palmae J233]|uniref:Ribosomal protein L7A family protein n=1 Tax=Alteracholeplasma palmae (strain ATCC 49389 / J233) TaxID=1318466 RepID=U4KP88_ALTPJ|nr:ribosomal L7Ae/L30e/S12e/Gadd45 family protein [Alteracholeplasma palmae]CCV64030.1 Ribosomal protein L7A family protein [Alteracholeplasma palmae J233]
MNKTLGLAYIAKKVVVGTDFVVESLRKKKLFLVVIATDASDNTKKKIYDKSKTYETQVIERLNSEELSKAIGMHNVKVIGILDKGFSDLLVK